MHKWYYFWRMIMPGLTLPAIVKSTPWNRFRHGEACGDRHTPGWQRVLRRCRLPFPVLSLYSDWVEDEQIARRLAALSARVARIEAQLALIRTGGTPLADRPVPAVEDSAAKAPHAGAAGPHSHARASLESRIGSQLFNRIGIIALLVGMAWFLKFAIDNHWIGPLSRVIIGVVAGIGIIAWSEWFRTRAYKAFSYSLKALGTGILYLSLWAAYNLFALMPAWAAFFAMLLVTAANAWLCWRQNSEILAFYAAVGGFLTPLLLWSAGSKEVTLFGYLLLLDLAVLALVALRPWSRLLLAAFLCNAIYAVGWYVEHYSSAAFALTASFVVVFFLLFSAAPQLLRNLRLASAKASLTIEDNLVLLLLPLLNALLAFAELYALLSEPVNATLRSWVAFAFSAFYLGMLRVARLPSLAGTPTRLPGTYLLLSVLAFTGAILLACSGRLIAVGWSAESMLLLALAWRLGIRMFHLLGRAVLGLAFTATVSLNIALHGTVRVLWNERFATYLAGVAAGVFAAWVAGRPQATSLGPGEAAGQTSELSRRLDMIFAGAGATTLLMVGVCLEIGTYWSTQYQLTAGDRKLDEQFSYSAWTMLFGAAMLATGFWRKASLMRWLGLVLLALNIGKVFLFDLRSLSQGYRILSFLGLGLLLLSVSFAYQRDLLRLRK